MTTKIEKHIPGRTIEEALRLSGLSDVLKVASNENALGPSPLAFSAIQAALSSLHLYPGVQASDLLQKLAVKLGHGLTPEHLIFGNGSSDVLRMITQTFLQPGERALIAAPTFPMYEILVRLFRGEVVKVPLCDQRVDLEALLQALDDRVRLVFVCNPNNPTGTIVSHDQVRAFLERLPPHVVAVFDEAYIDFVDAPAFPRMLEFIQAGHRVLVTRTFSKLYGLASLRAGYGIGPPDLIAAVRARQLQFNCSRLALVGAAAALDDAEHAACTRAMVQAGRAYFYRELEALGMGCVRSQGNFVFLNQLPVAADRLCAAMLQAGVIVRQTDAFGLPENIRLTVARPEDNQRVIAALTQALRG